MPPTGSKRIVNYTPAEDSVEEEIILKKPDYKSFYASFLGYESVEKFYA